MSKSIFKSWIPKIILVILIAMVSFLVVYAFLDGLEEGKRMKKEMQQLRR